MRAPRAPPPAIALLLLLRASLAQAQPSPAPEQEAAAAAAVPDGCPVFVGVANPEGTCEYPSPCMSLSGVAFGMVLNFEVDPAAGGELPAFTYAVFDGETGEQVASGEFALDLAGAVLDEEGGAIAQVSAEIEVSYGGPTTSTIPTFSVVTDVAAGPCASSQTQAFAPGRQIVPAFLSIFPLLTVIIIAVVTRSTLWALFFGVWFGTSLLYQYRVHIGFVHMWTKYVIDAMADGPHAIIIFFSFGLAGMVQLMVRSGGTAGMAMVAREMVGSSRWAGFICWCFGLCLFFDDYSNVLIMGSSMRPITDMFRISHAKLAFIIDSTAAPIASIAPISSWVGYELGLMAQAYKDAGLDANKVYLGFLKTIPMRFYPVMMLAFVCSNVLIRRDWGPMLVSERRARNHGLLRADAGKVEDADDAKHDEGVNKLLTRVKPGVPPRSVNAMLPVLAVIAMMIGGLVIDGVFAIKRDGGTDFSAEAIFSATDSFNVLPLVGIGALVVPVLLYWPQCIMGPIETLSEWLEGMKTMIEPLAVLVLAWTLGAVLTDIKMGDWIVGAVGDSISADYLSVLSLVISAVVAFATGSSWGTMAVLFPLIGPLAWNVSQTEIGLLYSLAAILAGSVWGDHCSPISDTTILSALSADCEVPEHVVTQAPYAAMIGGFAALVGNLGAPAMFGADSMKGTWISLPIVIVLAPVLACIGWKTPPYSPGLDLDEEGLPPSGRKSASDLMDSERNDDTAHGGTPDRSQSLLDLAMASGASLSAAGLAVNDDGVVLPTNYNIRRLSKEIKPGSGVAKC